MPQITLPGMSGLPVTIVGNTAGAQIAAKYIVPYNRMAANRRLRIIVDCTVTTALLALGPTVTVTLTFGGQTLSLTTSAQLIATMSNRPLQIIATITASESVNAQWGVLSVESQYAANVDTVRNMTAGQFTVPLTSNQEVSVSITFGSLLSLGGAIITPRTRVSEIVG